MLKITRFLFGLGVKPALSPYEKRRATVFNYCNFAAFVIAFIRLIYLIFLSSVHFTSPVVLINAMPLLVCALMAFCMHLTRYITAINISFIFYPPLLALMAIFTNDAALEIFILLYMLFVFFFLHRLATIIVTFCWVLVCFMVVHFSLNTINSTAGNYTTDPVLMGIDYVFGFLFFFLALYFIKFEVWKFEKSIRRKKEELRNLNAVKDKVFSVISHDLRSPISSIMMLLRGMESQVLTTDQVTEYLKEIRINVEQSGEMLDNLLAWARSQIQEATVKIEVFSVADTAEYTIQSLDKKAAEKNIQLINQVPKEAFAFTDENATRIVLRNLLTNAIKFTGYGGTIKVLAENLTNEIKVTVEDNGVGISKENQSYIFGSGFYTSVGTNKEVGTGLGLLICKDLVTKNGGALEFHSEKGIGSKFMFTLPTKN
jgi:two-component system, sensor histidine kinase and response regulator